MELISELFGARKLSAKGLPMDTQALRKRGSATPIYVIVKGMSFGSSVTGWPGYTLLMEE